MSYTMIFEDRWAKLPDGRYLRFLRCGCNNDNAGRRSDEFGGFIYTEEELEKEIAKYPTVSEGWDIKIYGKCRSMAEYAKHVRLMASRAVNLDEFMKAFHVSGYIYKGVYFTPKDENKEVFYTAAEWDNIVYDVWFGRKPGFYRVVNESLETVDDMIRAIENKERVTFTVIKRRFYD